MELFVVTNVLCDLLVVDPPFHKTEQFFDANRRFVAFFLTQLLVTCSKQLVNLILHWVQVWKMIVWDMPQHLQTRHEDTSVRLGIVP